LTSFHLYRVVRPDSAVHCVSEESQQTPRGHGVKPRTHFVLSPIYISLPSPRLSLSLLYFVFLCSTIGSFSLSLIYSLASCRRPRVHRGQETMAAIQPLHGRCADWHHRDVTMWCPAAAASPGGETQRAAEALDQTSQRTPRGLLPVHLSLMISINTDVLKTAWRRISKNNCLLRQKNAFECVDQLMGWTGLRRYN